MIKKLKKSIKKRGLLYYDILPFLAIQPMSCKKIINLKNRITIKGRQ